MRKLTTALICFFFPSSVACFFLRVIGYNVGRGVKIGYSFIWVDNIHLNSYSSIKHFNIIINKSLVLSKKSNIGSFNILNGPFELFLKEKAAIGKLNKISRGRLGITYGKSCLLLGKLSKITANHYIDLTKSVSIGNYSILAGIRSQIWTHGYYHASKGPERFRVDGEVTIGDNVYIGSMCLINPGVKISDSIIVGGNSTVSKSLKESGMYVSQPLRFISSSYEEAKSKLAKVLVPGLVEEVYEKRNTVN
jgi:acetyltransferase-like isoleucine patch superfamily enzyme